MQKKITAIIFLLSGLCFGQSSFQFGILPSVNLSKGLPHDFKVNFKIESRQEFKSGTFNGDRKGNYNYLLTDFQTIVAKNVALNKSAALGYFIRFRGEQVVHRSIQQFIINSNYPGLRLSHRFAADQTFTPLKAPVFRLRYRIAKEVALSGQTVDPKEFYLKFSNEYLNEWQGGTYDLEIRVLPFLGYAFNPGGKLELGLDYRLDTFVSGPPRHRFWIGLNFYKSI